MEQELKKDFPILNNRNIAYLDSRGNNTKTSECNRCC